MATLVGAGRGGEFVVGVAAGVGGTLAAVLLHAEAPGTETGRGDGGKS
ncbi:MAG: hypothetical protein ACM3JB_23325 [Acidobacteriaceae bacterium]